MCPRTICQSFIHHSGVHSWWCPTRQSQKSSDKFCANRFLPISSKHILLSKSISDVQKREILQLQHKYDLADWSFEQIGFRIIYLSRADILRQMFSSTLDPNFFLFNFGPRLRALIFFNSGSKLRELIFPQLLTQIEGTNIFQLWTQIEGTSFFQLWTQIEAGNFFPQLLTQIEGANIFQLWT